ncbi:MAG: eight-cysteine-cluster domain-containing protein [Nanoarchaeota archaeon]|nr:eight-cysteine-cluster domain-containing protein [Nanoarchaeota archaeon]
MRTLVIILLTSLVILAACQSQEQPDPNAECQTDEDCMTSGCSSTLCQKANDNPTYTTCEWQEQYACYRQISCGCNQGSCNWQETQEFQACLKEKQAI